MFPFFFIKNFFKSLYKPVKKKPLLLNERSIKRRGICL